MEDVIAIVNSDGQGTEFNAPGGRAVGAITVEAVQRVVEDLSRMH